MTNPITAKFKEALDPAKLLNRVSPAKSQTKPRKVVLIYEDGSEDAFMIDLDHTAFMKQWRDFYAWFARFREVKIEELG